MPDEKIDLTAMVGSDAWNAFVNQFMSDLDAMEQRKEKLKATLTEMKSYSTQFQEEIEKSNQKISLLVANGYTAEAEIAKQKSQAALNEIGKKMLESSGLWKQMTGQISELSLGQITQTYNQGRQLLDFIDGRKGAKLPADLDPELYANIDKDSEAVDKLREKVTKLHDEFAKKGSAQAFYADLKQGFDLIGEGFGNIGDGGMTQVVKGLSVIQGGWGNVSGQIKQIGKDLSAMSGNDDIAYAIENTIQMVDSGMKGLTGIAQMATGDILGGAMNVISSVASFFSIGQKVKAENDKLRKELHDHELKSYLAEFEINRLYRERYDWAKKIGESTIRNLSDNGKAIDDQSTANAKDQVELEAKLKGTEYLSGENYIHGTWFRKGRIEQEWSSLANASDEELDLYAKSGKLSEDGQKYYEALMAARKEGDALAKRQEEYLEEVRTTYGFTQIAGGSIRTGVIRGNNDNLRIDLDNGEITGKVTFQSGSSGLKQLSEWAETDQRIQTAQSAGNKGISDAAAAQAVTGNFTTVAGGLQLTTQMRMLNGGVETGGLSANLNNILLWGGGTYAGALGNYANIILRHDGSGQLAKGKINWDTAGDLKIENGAKIGDMDVYNGNLRWEHSGRSISLGSAAVVESGDVTVAKFSVPSDNDNIAVRIAGNLSFSRGAVEGLSLRLVETASDYEVKFSDVYIVCTNTTRHITVTLPYQPNVGRTLYLRRHGGYEVFIKPGTLPGNIGQASPDSDTITRGESMSSTSITDAIGDTAMLVYTGKTWLYHFIGR